MYTGLDLYSMNQEGNMVIVSTHESNHTQCLFLHKTVPYIEAVSLKANK